jgi:N-acetylglucosaminyl-diphospho-decaprenol L-rhamnosyltransferase
MSRTGIVVVTHNSAEVIGPCLESCLRAAPAEILVVDNCSSDATVDETRRFPGVKLIANEQNLGFAGAVNQGVRATTAPFLLLLNPDAELEGGLEDLERACSAPGVAAAAGLLTDAQGAPQRGFSVRRLPTAASLVFEILGLNRLIPANPVNRRYRCLDLDLTREQDVEQPAGAFLMFRHDAWERVGGFDEDYYPVWFEDVDFCRRLAAAGQRIRLVPAARARHRGGHSFRRVDAGQRVVWWHRSLLEYAGRYFGGGARWVISGAVLAGVVPRLVAGMLTGMRGGGRIRSYGKVISLALKCLWPGRGRAGMRGAASRNRTAAGEVKD